MNRGSMEAGEPIFRGPERRVFPHYVPAETEVGLLECDEEIDENTGRSRWDGRPPEYNQCVEAILRDWIAKHREDALAHA
jgi:hypothetical protein